MSTRRSAPLVVAGLVLGTLLLVGGLGWLLLPASGLDSMRGLSSWLDGARRTPIMGSLVMLVASGVALGAILASASSPLLDSFISRAAEISLALPTVVALVVLRAIGVHDALALAGTVAVVRGLSAAKGARAELHALLGEGFVVSARGLGASRLDLVRRHLLPHVLGGILSQCALSAASLVALEAALAFLGLGGDPSGWGALLADAARLGSPGQALFPALGVAATSGALLLVALHGSGGQKAGRSSF